MREIKFRAWDKFNNEFSNPTCIFQEDILMQYTGLKDKNGVEIYESDIVDKHFSNGQVGVVVYKHLMYCLEVHFCGLVQEHHLTINTEDCEVIGNIYENSELLK